MPNDRNEGACPVRSHRLPRIGAAVVAVAVLVAGCGAGGRAGSGSAAPDAGDTLTFGIDAVPACFDVHATSADSAAEIQRNVLDSLVSEDAGHGFHPWLATSWTVSPDFTSYTFHLRHGVTFTDGTPFTAEAVKANFDHIVAPGTKSQYAVNLMGPYAGTTVVDSHTARVDFSRPFGSFLRAAGTPYLGFYSPKVLAERAGELCAGGPADVGTGPFAFTRYTQGQSIVLTRNPRYAWAPGTADHQGPARLRSVVLRILPEDSTRVGALSSGQIDGARSIPPIRVKTLEADSNLSLMRRDQPGATYGIHLNTTAAPLDDQRVRLAVQQGVNVGLDVGAVYFGQYERSWGPLSPATPFYDPSLNGSLRHDPVAAGRLLDQAGWTGRDAQGYRTRAGRRLTLYWPALPAGAGRQQRGLLDQAVQADLARIGIEVLHPNLTAGEYNAKLAAGKYHLFSVSWAGADPDLLRLFFNGAHRPPAGTDVSLLDDAAVNRSTDAGAATADPAVRGAAYAGAQQRVLRLGAVLPLYVPASINGFSRDVHGVAFDVNAWLMFHGAWKA
ncbi:ABC transporter substrate-binding protein [Streptomyces roseifaciens]|uniref:ABC transporter substrate-binding protein n=1 Tax=Streptomyces roseifaciens TaxID=1488406 RepID=UPI000717FCFE|nr:ABC transporter substrate-binding protein [Streptomyces roseifaciens]